MRLIPGNALFNYSEATENLEVIQTTETGRNLAIIGTE